ncbi:MAG: aminofutalosine synthase MqnE [Phycisphaeraceae bacterium]
MDQALKPIAEKVYNGRRLSAEDGMTLLRSSDIWTIGELAHHVRLQRHGRTAYYNVNRHINYSNICALSCKFCEFYRKRGDEGAYEQSVEEIAKQAKQAAEAGATELHIVGGLHPYLPFSYYTDMLRAIREAAPRIHIKAFTAVEIVHLAKISKRPRDIVGVLKDLMDAGLGSLPGGGAEVFDDRIHDEAFKGKIRSDRWLDVHREAHRLGLMSNATMLYGHIESLEDRIHHLCLLREAQDEAIQEGHAGRFQTIIPLPFFPDGSELEHLPGPGGLENLKMLAVCRLMLDNFDHVKAFWIMQTLPMAQVSLDFGVDDIDGTVVWYDITKLSGQDDETGGTHQEVSVNDLRTAIIEAGYEPMERDTLYRPVIRDGADWHVADTATVCP